MPITDLPNELLQVISESLAEEKDISSLSRSCWQLFRAVFPSLYRVNYLRNQGSAITWAIQEDRTDTIQRVLETGYDLLTLHHFILAIEVGPSSLFFKLWKHKNKHGGIQDLDELPRVPGKIRANMLHTATAYGRYDIVKALLETGRVDVNIPTSTRFTPLYIAAHDGSHKLVRLLLEHGADVMTQSKVGRAPLSVAASHISGGSHCCIEHHVTNERECFLETVRILVSFGADLEHRDECGWTALHDAAMAGDCQMVELLASYGADPTARSRRGSTALHSTSLLRGQLNMTQLLVRLGADVTAINNNGQSVLWMASNSKESQQVAELLLQKGATMDPDREGNTPLHSATECIELVKVLLAHGADVNAVNNRGRTALHIASESHGNLEVVKLFIDHGADVNLKDRGGRIALVAAIQSEDVDIMRFLLESGSDPNLVSGLWHRGIPRGLDREQQKVANLLIQHGGTESLFCLAGEGPLHRGVIAGDLTLMESALAERNSIHDKDHWGRTALLIAALVGDSESVDWLLERKAKADVADQKGCSALHHATERGTTAIVRSLLDHGASVRNVEAQKRTPLHFASMYGQLEIARMLIDSGASLAAKDGRGETPLELASRYEKEGMVDLLSAEAEKAVPTPSYGGILGFAYLGWVGVKEHFSF